MHFVAQSRASCSASNIQRLLSRSQLPVAVRAWPALASSKRVYSPLCQPKPLGRRLSPAASTTRRVAQPGTSVQQRIAWPGQQQQQQRSQMTRPDDAAAAPGAAPSLAHPATIPLSFQDGRVADTASGSILLDCVDEGMTLNTQESRNGALVFGAASRQGPSNCWDVTVGQLKFKRFLACARNKLWWMTPEWGSSLHKLPPETQFLLLELEAGPGGAPRYGLVLPLIDGDFRGTLRPTRSWIDKEGSLCLRVESGDVNKLGASWDSLLLLACSSDPFNLVDAGVAGAAALSGGAAPRAIKDMPSSLDGFGWCTWDAFYSTVSARGLVEGLSSLAAGGVTPRLLIIDDGWQLTDVDPPYGKAPTAQLAEKLTSKGAAAEIFDGPREMVLETQDTFYAENAKLLAEASELMQPEVRNLFPTVANTGAISHHHAPPAASWDAAADAVAAAKDAEIAASLASKDGDSAAAAAAASAASSRQQGHARGAGSGSARSSLPPPVASRDDDDDALMPDWAQARPHKSSSAAFSASERAPLLPRQPGAAGSSAAPGGGGHELPSAVNKLLHETHLDEAAAAAEERLKAAASEAEEAMKRALHKAAPTPRQQFILIRWLQKAAGALSGLATTAFLLFYQWVVEPAPPSSLRTKAFAALAQGVLRGAMLTFFASASDFTRRLTSVEANAKFSRLDAGPEEDWEATPADLRGVVTHIKERFGIHHVYCWHGLPAYWGGVMPEAPTLSAVTGSRLVYPRPTSSIAEVEPSLLWSPAVLAGVGIADDPGRLYSAMHSYLASSGVDGVKVDCQAGVGLVGSVLGGGPAASRLFQAALEDSIATHFPGNHAINCMCHSSENFYRFSRTGVARVSDDYYPRDPASSTPHIGACAFNSLYLGALVQPDWDMFQSAHPAGVLHGMARAVSGGAVYVSDKPGQHDFELLRRLVLPDGSILRAQLPGRPTRDCLFSDVLRDGTSLLKVWNVNPVVGVVGVFNVQGSSWDRQRRKFHIHDARGKHLQATVTPHDVDAFRTQDAANAAAAAGETPHNGPTSGSRWEAAAAAAGVAAAEPQLPSPGAVDATGPQQQQQQYAVYRYGTEELLLCGGSEGVAVGLDPAGSDLVWISRLQTCQGAGLAPLGLIDMFNGGGAVLSCSMAPAAGHSAQAHGLSAVATLQLRGCGRFLAYSSVRPARVLVNLTPRTFTWDEFTRRLEFEVPQPAEGLACEVEVLYGQE